jgi:2-oxoglutarate ferredoxin oxidoreductase subunit alpha
MPTKTEQGDLYHACFGGHSEAPRIVVALSNVEDCFFGMTRAFNLAEKYQVPVVVLSDQYLAQRKAKIRTPDVSKVRLEGRLKPDPLTLQRGYERFRITETGVSPMSIPGMPGGFYTATGLEHDEIGEPKYSPDHHTRMTQKRFKKLDGLRREPFDYLARRYGAEDPEVGVIGWGSSEGVIREAIAEAIRLGYKVAALHPKLMYPLPEEVIADFIKPLKAVIVPELNYKGQYANLLRTKFKVDFIQLNKVSGLPFSPKEILSKIEDVEARCLV